MSQVGEVLRVVAGVAAGRDLRIDGEFLIGRAPAGRPSAGRAPAPPAGAGATAGRPAAPAGTTSAARAAAPGTGAATRRRPSEHRPERPGRAASTASGRAERAVLRRGHRPL